MIKSEIIESLASKLPYLAFKDAKLAVKLIPEHMTNALSSGKRIEIRGFGSFAMHYRPARVGSNPKSGEVVYVPESLSYVLNQVKNCVNGLLRNHSSQCPLSV